MSRIVRKLCSSKPEVSRSGMFCHMCTYAVFQGRRHMYCLSGAALFRGTCVHFCMSICLHDSVFELMTLKSIPRSITHADPHPRPGMHQKLPSKVPIIHLDFSQDSQYAQQETWAETIVMRMGLSCRRRLRDSTCLSQQMSTVKPLRL